MRGGAREGVDPLVTEEAFLLTQQICANVMAYCRVAMTIGGKRRGFIPAIHQILRLSNSLYLLCRH